MTAMAVPRTSQPDPRDLALRDVWAYDHVVILLVGLLMALGAALVYSATVTLDDEPFRWRDWWNTPLRQCAFVAVGFLWMLFVAALPHRLWAWESPRDAYGPWLLYALAFATLMVMHVVHALDIGQHPPRAIQVTAALSFQPAEIAKVVAVVWFAALVGRPFRRVDAWVSSYFPALFSVGALIVLVGFRDYGTAAVIGVVFVYLQWIAGMRKRQVAFTCLLGGVAGLALLMMKSYRLRRIWTFLDSSADESAAGYQITQSLIAVGSGGWFGRGLGQGVQKYGYLPQDNNDFIYAILCEELGVAGGLAIIVLFLLLLWRGWHIARAATDRFDRVLAAGVTLTLTLQAAFNVAVVLNVVPTKGISLPFVSAGGSGVLFLGTAAGLLASVGGRGARRRSGAGAGK